MTRIELQQLEERTTCLHSLFESNLLGIVVLDANHRVQMCNEAFEELFLFGQSEIEGFLFEGFEKVKDTKFKIMVPHMPPKDTKLDIIAAGAHVGSQSVRDFILKHKPDIVLSGHIHEARGTEKIEDTTICNAGMFCEGGYIKITKQPERLTAELKIVT